MQNKTNAVIDTVIIFTARMQELAEFYQKAFELGAPQAFGSDHLGLQMPNLYLGFDQVEDAPNRNGGISLWFRVDDVDATYQRLLDLGATSRYAPVTKPFGDRLASVYDPDGNLIGISQRKKPQ